MFLCPHIPSYGQFPIFINGAGKEGEAGIEEAREGTRIKTRWIRRVEADIQSDQDYVLPPN